MTPRQGRAVLLTAATAVAAMTASGGAAQAAAGGPAAFRAVAALTWSVAPSPNPGSSQGPSSFFGLTCLSASYCVAVGQYTSDTDVSRTLTEFWNGTAWSAVPAPSPASPPVGSRLGGVSCVSATDCTAVGSAPNASGTPKTLVESWNGSKWSIVTTPNRIYRNSLRSVSCVSASSCMAVGYGDGSALAESWNGSKWSIVTTPDPAPAGYSDDLSGVSCVSASRCTAVGYYDNTGRYETLIESWNGSKWSIVTSPNPGGSSDLNQLDGVSCVSASRCMAVGSHEVPDSYSQPLAESWNGSKWSAVPIPAAGTTGDNYLTDVSCVLASDCTAVGWHNDPSTSADRTLIESWNGTAWSITPSPNVGSAYQSNQLYGISCVSTTSCAAAGLRYDTAGVPRTLTERGTSG